MEHRATPCVIVAISAAFLAALGGDVVPDRRQGAGNPGLAAQALPVASRPRPALGLPDRALPPSEKVVSAVLESAVDRYLRETRLGNVDLTLRIPFAENGERKDGNGYSQSVLGGGKAEAAELWARIDEIVAGEDFRAYAAAIAEPGPLVLEFDLPAASWGPSAEPGLVAALRRGDYPGTRTRIFVLAEGDELDAASVYDYLYCVGGIGLDCSGFVYGVERCLARFLDLDLDGSLAASYGRTKDEWPLWSGIWLFTPRTGPATRVDDRIADLRPGDIILFRGRGGGFRHSAVIVSIDRRAGILRYAQCTDWAPLALRGVHRSVVRFDPGDSAARLGDKDTVWEQGIQPAFSGEPGLIYWKTDGDRYRTLWESGQSIVVRLDPVAGAMERKYPGFYPAERESGPPLGCAGEAEIDGGSERARGFFSGAEGENRY